MEVPRYLPFAVAAARITAIIIAISSYLKELARAKGRLLQEVVELDFRFHQ